ncbi:hypothetical protein Tco_1503160, partial [Tanacetum coccineum]
DEGLSLDAEDSPKQGRMIEEIDKDKTVNLVKSRELWKLHDTAKHRIESEHDDDRTLAETLLNIKRSAAKGKAIMKESEPPKKIKKKEIIQISLDEEFAKSFYEKEQAHILLDEVYAKQVEAQWIVDEERIPQEAKQIDEREKVINWNNLDVLRYHAVQNRPFSKAEVRKNMCTYLKNQGGYKMSHFKGISYEDIRPIFERVWDQNQAFVPKDSEIEKEVMKRPGFDLQQESSKKAGGSRKKTLVRKRAGEKQSDQSAKRQKMKDDAEKEDFKEYLNIVPEKGMNVEALQTKYPLIDWEIYTEDSRVSTEPNDDKEKALWVELKRLFEPDTNDLLELQRYMHDPLTWRLYAACGVYHVSTKTGLDIFMLVDKDPLTRGLPMLMLVNKLQADQHSEMADELLKKIFILANRPRHHFQQNPGKIHWTVVKTILKYLRNTKDMVLVYGAKPNTELKVSCYADASFQTDKDDTKSQTGYVFVLNDGAMRKFINGLGNVVPSNKRPIEMLCDNEPTITIANDAGILKGSRYFQRKYYYIREVIQERENVLKKVHTNDNVVDPFTKPMPFNKHFEQAMEIGIVPASSLM